MNTTPKTFLTRASARLSVLAITAAACAAGGVTAANAQTPVNLGPEPQDAIPSVAVDQNGTAYAAWEDAGNHGVDYCVLPDGATACSASGTLTPAGGAQTYDESHVQVLIDNGTVSILAQVGLAGDAPSPYTPMQGWQTPDGSSSFAPVNGGKSVAYAPDAGGNTIPLQALVVPGSNTLGVDWFGYQQPPTFDAFPGNNPPECSTASPACPFATLEPASNPDPVGNNSGSLASESGPNPGILGVYGTYDTTGPFGCPLHENDGSAFVYGSGLQSPTNDYNVSPGSPNSAWKVAATVTAGGDCESSQWAVAGGPSGLGMIENAMLGTGPQSQIGIVYRPFDQTAMTFGQPVTIANTVQDESSLSQDAAGNLYGTFNLNNPDGPIALVYSSDGGKTWSGPAPLEPDPQFGNTFMSSAVGADGKGWAIYDDSGSVYGLEFDAADAGSTVAATLGGGQASSSQVVVPLTCFSVPCNVNVAMLGGGSPQSADVASAHKTTLGFGQVTITRHGTQKLVVRLTKGGARLLAAHHGRLKAIVHETTSVGSYTENNTVSIKIKKGRARR